jgi:hypothetical protein
MAFSVIIKLTTAGADTGPTFSLFSNVDSYATAFETGVSKTSLTSVGGYISTLVPDNTTTIRVKSISGSCPDEYVDLNISGLPTPTITPTPTASSGGSEPSPTLTPTPTITITPTTTPTITTTPTETITPTITATESAICYYTQTGSYPLSGGIVSTTGLIKVTTGIIHVWAKYNSAGTSSGTASFGLTIGGLSATGGFTITSFGQVGYTNSGGSNNLTYFVLTPGTYEYTLVKSDTYSAGNNVNLVYTTGGATDPAVATNMDACTSEPLGPYLSLLDVTPTITPTLTLNRFYVAAPVSDITTTYCVSPGYVLTGALWSYATTISGLMNEQVYIDEYGDDVFIGINGYKYAVSLTAGINTYTDGSSNYELIEIDQYGSVWNVLSPNCSGSGGGGDIPL